MRPTIIVGDVQGDVERLAEGLTPYDADTTDTIFLGDFFQGGILGTAGGCAAAKLARNRPHTRSVLGNHEVYILTIVELARGVPLPTQIGMQEHLGRRMPSLLTQGPDAFIAFWKSRRGDWADVEQILADPDLEAWIRALPILLTLDDGTLVQHPDTTLLLHGGETIDAINAWGHGLLATPGGSFVLLPYLSARQGFVGLEETKRYLTTLGSQRVVHGHSPHGGTTPRVSHGGLVWCFDGKFSRYWATEADETPAGPIEATIGPLPPLL